MAGFGPHPPSQLDTLVTTIGCLTTPNHQITLLHQRIMALNHTSVQPQSNGFKSQKRNDFRSHLVLAEATNYNGSTRKPQNAWQPVSKKFRRWANQEHRGNKFSFLVWERPQMINKATTNHLETVKCIHGATLHFSASLAWKAFSWHSVQRGVDGLVSAAFFLV